ncbi:TPA: GPO family capsid scaffolding protein [Serratia liquefaciens]
MPQANITTDWICIATAGPTVDGRTIEPQWLHDAAETYSRNTYTAMIWPHHPQYELGEREFTCNLGEVDALRAEDVDGKTKLYAKLIPNQFLIEANRMGQKLFTSAEFWDDFGGSGREYLFGLAVTDIPASLGTEKITLVFDGEQYNGARGSVETFSLGKMKHNKPSMWGRLFATRKNKTFATDDTKQTTQGEDETKMEELRDLIEKMLNRIKALEDAAGGETVENPEEAAAEVGDLAEEIAEVADEVAALADEVAENPEDEILAEEFSAAKTKMAALTKRFSTQGTTDKSSRRSSRASRRQGSRRTNLAAKNKGGKDAGFSDLKDDMNEILKKFNALEGKAVTKVPGKALGGSEKAFEFL